MDVIQTGTNIATVKISELPKSTETNGRATLATNNQTNQSEALELPAVADATQAALASAATANQAAQAADTARENIAGDLAQKSSMFTGAIMGKGGYYLADPGLFTPNSFTIRAIIGITKNLSDISTAEYVIGTGGSESVSVFINKSKQGYIRILDGSGSRDISIDGKKLLEAIIVSNGEQSYSFFNSIKNSPGNKQSNYTAPKGIAFGRYYSSGVQFKHGNCIALQIFNFPFSDEDAKASWNNGRPELWRAPDVLRYKSPTVWPTATYKSGSTFRRSGGSIVETDNIPAANGFSKDYQRFEQNPSAYCGFLNVSTLNTEPFRWKFTIEYRADSSVTVEMKGGYSRPALTLDANTGDAKTVQFVTDAGYGATLRTRGGGTYLEVATISVEPANIVCNLIPASLTPTVWKDISGQGNDIPYVPVDSNPAECEMAYENMGFPDTIIGTEAPAVIPNFIGQRYVDTTNKAEYTAFGMTSASDWK